MLSTELTPELVDLGNVRELISKVQQTRKDNGYEVVDHIKIYVSGSDKFNALVNEFKKEMSGVYSNNINQSGLSEAPMVYKKREYIKESLKDLVNIEDILIPVFNYKQD